MGRQQGHQDWRPNLKCLFVREKTNDVLSDGVKRNRFLQWLPELIFGHRIILLGVAGRARREKIIWEALRGRYEGLDVMRFTPIISKI